MKFWRNFLFFSVFILAFAGCSDDDDGKVVVGDTYVPYHSQDMTTDDGKVTQLLKHKVGRGVPVVILGDGFVDKDFQEGKFRNATAAAIDALFSVHPLKSLRDYFDVYEVTAVSYNYGYDFQTMTEDPHNFNTAFRVGKYELIAPDAYTFKLHLGDQTKMVSYVKKGIDADRLDDATIVMLVNNTSDEGLATFYTYDKRYSEIPSGCGMAYVQLMDVRQFDGGAISQTMFARTLLHEFGHAFAKLADEYASEEGRGDLDYALEEVAQEDLESERFFLQEMHDCGYCRNVSTESDVAQTCWADFSFDNRYHFEKLGCYEGGDYHASGVYRPMQTGIMNDYQLSSYFNVISRAMIYKRCMRIAYGDSWEFNYEDFVKFDLEKAKAAYQAEQENHPDIGLR